MDNYEYLTGEDLGYKPGVVEKCEFEYFRNNIFACLFSVHNTISLLRHEQICLVRHSPLLNIHY